MNSGIMMQQPWQSQYFRVPEEHRKSEGKSAQNPRKVISRVQSGNLASKHIDLQSVESMRVSFEN